MYSRTHILGQTLAIFGLGLLVFGYQSCGSKSVGDGSSSGSGVTITITGQATASTGVVSSPSDKSFDSGKSLDAEKDVAKADVSASESGLSSATCKLSHLTTGKLLGTATTDGSGQFTMSGLKLEDLKGSAADETGSSPMIRLVIRCDQGSVMTQGIASVQISSDGAVSINAGEINSNTTVASALMLERIRSLSGDSNRKLTDGIPGSLFSQWQVSKSFDPDALYALELDSMKSATTCEEGKGNLAALKQLIQTAGRQGSSGYSDMGDYFHDIVAGKLSSSRVSDLQDKASQLGFTYAKTIDANSYTKMTKAQSAMQTMLTTYAGDSTQGGSIKNNADFRRALVGPLTQMGSETQFTSMNSTSYMDLAKQCRDQAATGNANAYDMFNKGGGQALIGTLTQAGTSGTGMAAAFQLLSKVDYSMVTDPNQLRNIGTSYGGIILQAGSDATQLQAIQTNSTMYRDYFVTNIQSGQLYDPATANYSTLLTGANSCTSFSCLQTAASPANVIMSTEPTPVLTASDPQTCDTKAPTLSNTLPLDAATGVDRTKSIKLTFSEGLDINTINTTNITVKKTSDSSAVAGSFGHDSGKVIFKPTSSLADSTNYTVTVTTNVKDAAGNAFAAAKSFSFATAASLNPCASVPVNTACNDGNPATTGDYCNAAHVCVPPETCANNLCFNGVDDDGDGLVDFADPGCDDSDGIQEAIDKNHCAVSNVALLPGGGANDTITRSDAKLSMVLATRSTPPVGTGITIMALIGSGVSQSATIDEACAQCSGGAWKVTITTWDSGDRAFVERLGPGQVCGSKTLSTGESGLFIQSLSGTIQVNKLLPLPQSSFTLSTGNSICLN